MDAHPYKSHVSIKYRKPSKRSIDIFNEYLQFNNKFNPGNCLLFSSVITTGTNRIDVVGDSSPVSRAESLKAVKKVFRDAQPRLGQVSVKNSVVESKVTQKGWDVTFTSQGTYFFLFYYYLV